MWAQLGRAPAPADCRPQAQRQPGLRRRRGPAHERRKARRAAARTAAATAEQAAETVAVEVTKPVTEQVASTESVTEQVTATEEPAKTVAEEAAENEIVAEMVANNENGSEKEAEEAATADTVATKILDAVIAVGIGVTAVERRVAENAAARKNADEDTQIIISSDEEEGDEERTETLYSIQSEMVEKETDAWLLGGWRRDGTRWIRSEDGRLVKRPGLAKDVVMNTEFEHFSHGRMKEMSFSPSQSKKLRNLVRKRARTALSSDSSPTLPACKSLRKAFLI